MTTSANPDRSLRVSDFRHFIMAGRTVLAAFGSRPSVLADLADSSPQLSSRHGWLGLHHRKPFRHQRGQLISILIQVIQDLGYRTLHLLERLVPAVQCLLPQELPEPLNQV